MDWTRPSGRRRRHPASCAAIDVGTTKVCTLVGDLTADGELRVIGVGLAPSSGMSRGVVSSMAETVESVRLSVAKAERSAGTRVVSAYVGVTGSHIDSLNNRGIVAVPHSDRPISEDDVARVIDGASTLAIPTNRRVIHVLPRAFEVDGQGGVADPVGMYGQRLDVDTHIITGAVSALQNLTRCVEESGVLVEGLVLQPLASAQAALEDEERRQGVVLADIGGGTTDVAVFLDGSVHHTAVLPLGGYHLTKDLVVGLRMPFAAAEEAKAHYGHALASAADPGEEVRLGAFGAEGTRSVLRRRLCEILQARAEELLEMIYTEVKRAGFEEMLPAGLVLTGGCARLPGFDFLAEEVLGLPARIGYPQGVVGLVEDLHDPAYATAVGLLKWAAAEDGELFRPLNRGSGPGVFRWLGDLARALLPQ